MKLFGTWKKIPGVVQDKAAFKEGDASQDNSLGQNRKILVVDDNQVVLKAFELKLKALGFQVLLASDGTTAVSIARREKPALIVLDIHFPPDVGSAGLQWNGFNIMQWMQRFNDAANIPVIFITSDEVSKFKDQAIAAGAAACFQKPINHEEFVIAVRRSLGQTGAKPQAA